MGAQDVGAGMKNVAFESSSFARRSGDIEAGVRDGRPHGHNHDISVLWIANCTLR